MRELMRLAGFAMLGFIVILAFARFTLIGIVRDVDEGIFEALVPWLQPIPGLASFCEVATDLGAIPLNRAMLIVLAILAAGRHRHLSPVLLVAGVGVGADALQNITNRIIQGSVPSADVIGAVGPYFSGGVMRVVLLTGIALTLFLPTRSTRWVLTWALVFGLFEAITRLTLGRHWPLDLVVSFPIGSGLIWLFRRALATCGFLPEATSEPTNVAY